METHQLLSVNTMPSEQVEAPKALISRPIDFWLLGGASILIWLVVVAMEPLRNRLWAIDHHFTNLVALSATLSLVVNYPHFMASYRLAYTRGREFSRQHWWQLVAVPTLLVGLITAAYFMFHGGDQILGAGLASGLQGIGLNAGQMASRSDGQVIMGLLINLMYISVGWHYSKQTYGCMMVYARFDQYKLTPQQCRLLRWTLHSVWLVNFTFLNGAVGEGVYYGVQYLNFGIPRAAFYLSQALLVGLLLACVVTIYWPRWRQDGVLPGRNMLVAKLAFLVWWVPPLLNNAYLYYAAPFFHSLQYLAFAYRVERSKSQQQIYIPIGLFIGLGIAGFLSFEALPNLLDLSVGFYDVDKNLWFFFCAFHVFINIHHYFLDNALWRLRDSRLRGYLGL